MASTLGYHPKQILCPIDMSELADLALKYAHLGATMFKAELTLLNAVHFEYPRYLSKEVTEHVVQELERAKLDTRKHLADHAHKVLGEAINQVKIHYRAVDVDPASAILQTIEDMKSDLIVMGTHGYSGFKHWMLGSVAEKMLHLSKVPVFTIRQKENDFIDTKQPSILPQINHILCPCNLSASASQALITAASISKRLNAKLTVLLSLESPTKADKTRLLEWLEENLPGSDAVNSVVYKGEAADQTIRAVKELGADLIVIGICHRPFGEGGTVVGRTSERVVRYAPVPVLSVPYFA
jgi:nucleotide-binding universal stress UspA family protein